jgi:hypothetical protein
MKKTTLTLLSLLIFCLIQAQSVTKNEIVRASTQFMKSENPGFVLRGTQSLQDMDDETVGYIVEFAPSGFMIVPSSESIRPLYAYSFKNDFNLSEQDSRKAKALFTQDIANRICHSERLSALQKREITLEWEDFLNGSLILSPVQYWPPEGSTPSGGWVITDWTQSDPYNLMCPMDLNAGSRSVVGCPATAMGQILNYHETLNGTTFNDGDDYYHSYGSNNQYWIDDDHVARDFPSWDSLNTWLTSMEYAYQVGTPVTTEMKAALSFACGVAAHQVYTASVSGTFGIEQAWESFQRFGFSESYVIYPTDTSLNTQIANNIKVALPVQLGLLVDPPGSGGHNVVVDGYNTDAFYHFNFGWGGSANGWYTLPPTNIAYNLTIIEGAVLDIKSDNYTGIGNEGKQASAVSIYPVPATDHINISNVYQHAIITLYDLTGKVVLESRLEGNPIRIATGGLPAGIYLVEISVNGKREDWRKIVIE